MQQDNNQSLSGFMVILSLVNGMIGGLILILPVLAIQGGYVSTFLVIGITGLFSFYSAKLCMLHIGNSSDLDEAIYKHFENSKKMKVFYDVCVCSNLLLITMLYFELITIQWIGLVAPHHYTQTNAYLNALFLFVIVILMKFYDFGANLMGYGIISIASYLIFLGWVVIDQQTTGTPAQYKAIGTGALQMAAAMGQAFAIQMFYIPVLKKNNQPQKHILYVLIAYVVGGLAYYYIAYMGSIGIIYRTAINYGQSQITIEDYFGDGAWEVNLIQLIYLVHLYSVSPEFILISKKRLFGIFSIEQSPKGSINSYQLIYIIISIVICLLVSLFQISIRAIIEINGAVIGFFFIYFIPCILHVKCTYFKKPIVEQVQNKENVENYQQMVEEKGDKDQYQKQQQKIDNKSSTQDKKKDANQLQQAVVLPDLKQGIQRERSSSNAEQQYCQNHLEGISGSQKCMDIFLIVSMMALGLLILVNGVHELVSE